MWQICLNVTIKVGESRQYGRHPKYILFHLSPPRRLTSFFDWTSWPLRFFFWFFFGLIVACESQPRGRQFRRRRSSLTHPPSPPPHRLPNFHPIRFIMTPQPFNPFAPGPRHSLSPKTQDYHNPSLYIILLSPLSSLIPSLLH